MNIFKIKKEEQWIVLVMLIVFITFNVLVIAQHWDLYTKGALGGFYSIFEKHFRMSGYDCWSWITISGMRIHFETVRHPLYLTFLYPLYLLDHWLIQVTGVNFAVFFMSVIIIFSAVYSVVFMYRIFREVLDLQRYDATMLTLLLFSFGHVLVPAMVPDHFIISMMFLTMTLYITGMKMKKHRPFKAWQSMILLFFTTGMATSNGAKTMLAGLFANGKKFFSPKFLLIGIIFPLACMFGIQRCQYYTLEVPQERVIHNIEQANLKKDSAKVERHKAERDAWLKTHNTKPAGNGPITKLMDISTPRIPVAIENFFGESMQLHEDYLLQDMSFTRPVIVKYRHAFNYVIEGLIVALFILGIVIGCRHRFFQMLLTWFACDVTLHLILGFAVNEVYIMTAGWAFIIPISYAYIMKALSKSPQQGLRIFLTLLTVYLWVWNGGLIMSYLL